MIFAQTTEKLHPQLWSAHTIDQQYKFSWQKQELRKEYVILYENILNIDYEANEIWLVRTRTTIKSS
jgi:hypothetical protein